jgi:hypothetical protein
MPAARIRKHIRSNTLAVVGDGLLACVFIFAGLDVAATFCAVAMLAHVLVLRDLLNRL